MTEQRPSTRALCAIVAVLCFSLGLCASAGAQGGPREHLTPGEIDQVREAQELDKRTDVFISAVDRRLSLLADPHAAQAKQAQKESALWADLPRAARPQLLADAAQIIDEAVTNIEDTAARTPDSPLLNKALRKLGTAATRWQAQLAPLLANAPEAERPPLERALEELQEIIDAAQKLPPPAPAKKGHAN